MDYLPLPGTPVEDLDTPAIIVDLDIAESNIKAMADFALSLIHISEPTRPY